MENSPGQVALVVPCMVAEQAPCLALEPAPGTCPEQAPGLALEPVLEPAPGMGPELAHGEALELAAIGPEKAPVVASGPTPAMGPKLAPAMGPVQAPDVAPKQAHAELLDLATRYVLAALQELASGKAPEGLRLTCTWGSGSVAGSLAHQKCCRKAKLAALAVPAGRDIAKGSASAGQNRAPESEPRQPRPAPQR